MFLTWVSICRVTAPLIIIFLVCLKKCANLSGWILITFHTRDCITMLTLFKSIVLSRLDFGSQLWSPFLIKHITQLEKIQRSFTKHITGMNDMPYHKRLKSLGLYSLQRRRERYCIIYIWKIIEGLIMRHFPCQCRSHLRSISSCSVLRYKTQLDIFLGRVEDLPCLPGFDNSLNGGE